MKQLSGILITLLLSSFTFTQAQSRLDSVGAYLQGSWKLKAMKYYDGKPDNSNYDIQLQDKGLQVFETKNGMRKLKYQAETRLDSLDEGIVVVYAYLSEKTATSTCNTLLLHIFPQAEDTCVVSWFEFYFLRDEEKLSQYIANYQLTRIVD